jgi:hypothetical protein
MTYRGAFRAVLPLALALVLGACKSPVSAEADAMPEMTGTDATFGAMLEAGSEGADAGSPDDGGTTADDGGMAPDATAECNLVPQQAGSITPTCPITGVSSEGGTSTDAWLGGTIADGVYTMTNEVVWESACGSLEGTEVRATLEVHGGTMALVAYGPDGLFTPSSTKRFSFTYSVSGTTNLSMEQACPSTGLLSFSVSYTAHGNQLALSGLNGLLGSPTFTRL